MKQGCLDLSPFLALRSTAFLFFLLFALSATAENLAVTSNTSSTDNEVRNACQDADCLKAVYRFRNYDLAGPRTRAEPTVQSTQPRVVKAVTTTLAKKYPPYPDVWELEVPLSKNTKSFPRIRDARLDNGDVMIGFVSSDRAESKGSIASIRSADLKWITFFGRQSAVTVDEAGAKIRMDDGLTTKPIMTIREKDYYPGTAELKDGSYVVSSQNLSHDCYVGPAKNTLNRYQSKIMEPPNFQRKLLMTKVVFLLLDEPIAWTGAGYKLCDEVDKKLSVRVTALQGEIIPLQDGGFLLIDDHVGWVVRFNADLSTQTYLLNRKLFIFDMGPSKDPLFIDKITGKNYLDEKGNIRMQQALDDLYDYLIHLNDGKNR